MSRGYTHDERYKIIRYILDNEILSLSKGNAVWKAMEKAKIINRSWHSIRTQFYTTIINMLYLFNLTDYEQKQILTRYTKESKSDSEISTLPVEGSKSYSESSSSLDLLIPVKTSYNSTCTPNTNECFPEELKSQEHQADEYKQINVECNDEFTKDTSSVQENSFSLEEDTELILFFKTHHEHKIHDKTAYNVFQIKTSSIRSCGTLEDRFVNHIIPNLFNYKCLTYDEMIVLYNRWDIDIPKELQLRIRPVVAKPTRYKKIGTTKITIDKAIQVNAPALGNRQCNLYRAGKYIGWSDNGVKHIFIPKIDTDRSAMRKEIHDQFMIPDENIHVVSLQAYTTMNTVINCDNEFKLLCNEFVKTGKFNSTHVVPILDKMNQANVNFTVDLAETVSNVQIKKET